MTQNADSASVYDVVVIGAGPGGYVSAIRAAQLGLKVACVDKGWWGGVCLNVGCIPSKAMLDSSERYYEAKNKLAGHGIVIGDLKLDLAKLIARKDGVVKGLTTGVQHLFKKNKVTQVQGTARIAAKDTVEVKAADGSTQSLKTKRILIATGSVPTELPGLPFDGKFVVTSTEALSFIEVPKKLVVVGGGYIGVEMGSVWARLGSEVTVLEFTPGILPLMDQELALNLQRLLEKQGLKFKFGAAASKAVATGNQVTVTYKMGDKEETIVADKCLVCTGRKPLTDGLGLKEIGVELDPRGFVKIDDHYKTNVDGIYAIGDVVGGLMLAHKAEEEGVAVAEMFVGKAGHVNYKTVPGVVYTHPELAQVGITEAEAKKAGIEVKVGKFPMLGNGRAKSIDDADGWVKMVADAKTDRLLGVQILAAHASDMLAECVVAMELAASSEDVARSFHAHPTLSEAVKEAAMAVDKRAIHI